MKKPLPNSFESSLVELEAIVASLEAGHTPLADALEAYQKGALLVRQCHDTLSAAEARIQVLEQGLLRDFETPTSLSDGSGS